MNRVRLKQSHHQTRHVAADGHLVRVIRGVYVRRPEWEALSARDRHALRVVEHVSRLSGHVVASHWSAAALWGLPVVDCWPDVTEVIDTGRATTVTNGSLRRRPGPGRGGGPAPRRHGLLRAALRGHPARPAGGAGRRERRGGAARRRGL